ncbi:porin [Paraburkholderia sp. ZP32-5]|uniref:porin n=1 Tax=Paraburkholderia sp. ZP32-5 TaxID=2883245 RepID=UPI001F46D67D|nr:porin [Paraburkholderia sp. ZP32-5]
MKKPLYLAAVVGMFSSPLYAQSSVTLYGAIDNGLSYISNSGGKSLVSATTNNIYGSRWGLLGSEDLGGGMRAIFQLENGFNAMNGTITQGGTLFGRQAYAGLSGDFGKITLGRQYDSVGDFVGQFGAASQWAGDRGNHPGDLDNLHGTNRTNNAVKYLSPKYAGFTFGGMYSFGGVAGQMARNQIWSIGTGYANGPLALGAGYLNIRNPNYSFFGDTQTGSLTASNMTNLTYSGYASAGIQEIFALGGRYSFSDSFRVSATYSNTRFGDLGAEPGIPNLAPRGSTAIFNNAEINMTYFVVPTVALSAAYDYTKGAGVNDALYHQLSVGADYFLSKTTDLYLTGFWQHAAGTDSTGKPARATITGLSPSSNANQIEVNAGIRHKF